MKYTKKKKMFETFNTENLIFMAFYSIGSSIICLLIVLWERLVMPTPSSFCSYIFNNIYMPACMYETSNFVTYLYYNYIMYIKGEQRTYSTTVTVDYNILMFCDLCVLKYIIMKARIIVRTGMYLCRYPLVLLNFPSYISYCLICR